VQEAKAGATPVQNAMYMCPWEEYAGNPYVNITFKDGSNFTYHLYRGWSSDMDYDMVEDIYSGTYTLGADGHLKFTATKKFDARNDGATTEYPEPIVWDGVMISDSSVQLAGDSLPYPGWDDPADSLYPFVCQLIEEN